ncbi:glycoside hydrolase family 3 N-terminal domain-containing protein [Oceanobacillus sojae]|uniref:glycoside hydrolase family 3 N-terminal domain-containing protein n=1 Tax=Oceanobacillus sojae TaxID=582851 RepID=UPI00362DD437
MNYKAILKQMSLEDKIALCSGADFWHTKEMEQYGIPKMMMSDGPHGLRKQEESADMLGVNESVPATSFPTAVTTGSSWDPKLLGRIGEAIAKEAATNKVGVVLGPGLNIKRNPLCGRNFEYISEDPYLSGKMGASFIKEAQKNGIGTSVKHFLVTIRNGNDFLLIVYWMSVP